MGGGEAALLYVAVNGVNRGQEGREELIIIGICIVWSISQIRSVTYVQRKARTYGTPMNASRSACLGFLPSQPAWWLTLAVLTSPWIGCLHQAGHGCHSNQCQTWNIGCQRIMGLIINGKRLYHSVGVVIICNIL